MNTSAEAAVTAAVETTEKTYNKSQFSKACGFSPSHIHYLIEKGRVKNKEKYTQKDVDTYLAKKGKQDAHVVRIHAHANGATAKEKKYTVAQLAQKCKVENHVIYSLRSSGKLENKVEYNEKDLEKVKVILEERKNSTKSKPAPIVAAPVIDESYDPYDIVSYDPDAERNMVMDKFIAKLKKLQPGSPFGVNVSATVKFHDTRAKAQQWIADAKKKVNEDEQFKDAAFSTNNFDNQEKIYTHSIIKRIN